MEEGEGKWSVAVEDLIDRGDIEGAISLLDSVISKLETLDSSSSDLSLACALSDLANLYHSKGFSIRADELQNRALLIRLRSQHTPPLGDLESVKKNNSEEIRVSTGTDSPSWDDDDWEAIADRGSDEVFSPHDEAGVSNLSLDDTKSQTPKRRGRGAFLFKKNDMYSDQLPADTAADKSGDEVSCLHPKGTTETSNLIYGTSHVLVLADFPPSTRTTELEKLFGNFRDQGVVIRWVNDTLALAVFRTPSIAREALSSTHCPFTVRSLDENDSLLSSLSTKDMEPPYPRPKTSASTARRLIAQGMGQKLSATFGSNELKKQEEERRNHILERQRMRDEAWGAEG
ncbi:coiled-coil protein [Tasmannia lanceolata]|uniref:coiled-coil protein n=1 Tax=Tasmannia lanceolata TaxID=3420 RepID=UPI004062B69B